MDSHRDVFVHVLSWLNAFNVVKNLDLLFYISNFSDVSEIKFRWEGATLELRTTYLVDVADVAVRSGSELYAVAEAEDATNDCHRTQWRRL